jgi:deoxyribonuclease IV
VLIGLDRIAMIHLNDSKADRGSRYDRHEHLGAGRIGATGLGHLLRHPALAGVPCFLETPGMEEGYDALNVTNALLIAADLPMEPVPPEALTVRGARGRTPPD